MPLEPDSQLGHYVVTAPLGAGGMGEVWRARDTTLDREVAIKVLPDAFAEDAERLARFSREAKLLASLNHPNIAAVYGLHEAAPSTSSGQPVRFIAMELVPGEDLTEALARGALTTDKVLDIARQVAGALEAAHDQGVVHRDLKPANIRCTPDGTVKVLDFGLAKVMGPGGTANDPAQSPTMTVGSTAAGVVLGTAAYMSPEQARGEAVDRRADIWAFGCLLFEMLAGRLPFAGTSITDLLAAVIRDEPAWDALPAAIPAAMQRLLRRCLAKDPRHRLRHIGDAVLELHDAGEERPEAGASSAGPPQRKTGLWVLALISVAALTLAIVGWQRPSRTAASRTTRVDLRLEGLRQGGHHWGVSPIALSPDGRTVAFVVEGTTGAGLAVRSLDGYGTRLLPATEGAVGPFFSPDGRTIGFFAENELRTVSVSGAGTARTVHRLEASMSTFGATWTPADTIVFAVEGRGLVEIPATGGDEVSLTTLDRKGGELQHSSPFALPDGRHLLFTIAGGRNLRRFVRSGPALLSRDTGRWQTLVDSDAAEQPHYVKSGHLVYGEHGRVYAAPLDLAQGRVTGSAVIVAEGVHVDLGSGVFYYTVTTAGTLLYLPLVQNKLVWVGRDGAIEPILEAPGDYVHPRISPGGDRVALIARRGADTDVWVVDVRRGNSERLTDGGDHSAPLWTPRSEEVTYGEFGTARASPSAATVTQQRIVARRADGSGEVRVLLDDDHTSTPMSWTPDGRTLLYDRRTDTGELEVWSVSPGGDDPPAAVIASGFNDESARVSPDGNWVAYVSHKTGQAEVYVASYPALDRRWQVSSAGGSEPVWGPQSQEILYRSGWDVLSVPLEQGSFGLRTGVPVKLFDGFFNRANLGHAHFDVAPDGERFVMVQENPAAFDRLQLVFGWDTELAALAADSRPRP